MRLFIAINFDDKTKQNILTVQQRLRELGQGNFSRRENLHLTLAFLGEITPTRVAAICNAMDHTVIKPMTLTFDHVGCFRRDGGDIWWIGIKENKTLLSLQQNLTGHLATEGFHLEIRRFSPHITLAREVWLTGQHDHKEILREPFSTKCDTISLMRSERIGGKLIYTEQYFKK